MIKLTMEVDILPDNFTGIAEYDIGDKWWYKDGKVHRLDGPACEFPSGHKQWYQNGLLHRLDGPAIEYKSGDKSWYIDGKKYSKDNFNKMINTCNGKVIEIEGKKYKLVLTDK